jgi:hypothetical protein
MGTSVFDLQAMSYLTQHFNCKSREKEYNTVSISITIIDTERRQFTDCKCKGAPVSKHHVTKRYKLHAYKNSIPDEVS